MKQDIYNTTKPTGQPAMCRFVRTHRHKARVVYAVHTCMPGDPNGELSAASVTSQSGKALTMLGQACLDAQGSAHTPFITVHVEYSYNKRADHPQPSNFHSDFSLAEFAAHHHKWKQEVTEYALPTEDEEPL